jgi:GT2 family glycosyltransferase
MNTRTAPAFSFVIPVRDDAARLLRCLASIRANRYAGSVEIVVVDNGSRDGSADVARSAGAIVIVLPGLTVAELRNAGARCATGEILAFVDADHEIGAEWIASVANVLSDSDVAATGAPCVPPPDANWVQRAYDCLRSHRPGPHEVEWLGSGNLAIRRTVFAAIGGFDSSLQTCEDVDLCNRLRQAGGTIVSDARATNVHFGDPATLHALFTGELWRGRDNLRVFFRGPVTWRSIPSLAIPLIDLVCVAAAMAGAATLPWGGGWLLFAAGCIFAFWSVVRAAKMTRELAHPRVTDVFANLIVAGVYDIARALALVANAGHGIRRGAIRPAATAAPVISSAPAVEHGRHETR